MPAHKAKKKGAGTGQEQGNPIGGDSYVFLLVALNLEESCKIEDSPASFEWAYESTINVVLDLVDLLIVARYLMSMLHPWYSTFMWASNAKHNVRLYGKMLQLSNLDSPFMTETPVSLLRTREFKYHSNGTVKFIVVPKLFSSHSRQLITTKNWITIPPSHSNLRTIGQTVVTATSIPFKCSIFEDILSRKLRFKDKDFRYSDFEASRYAKVNEAMSIKINGLTQDRFRLSVFPVSLAGAASEWFTKECIGSITTWDNMVEKFILKFHHLSDHDEEEETEEDDNLNEINNVPEIFKIKGNLFDFETPLCEAFHKFNCLLKIDTDLFTYDIQNFKTYDEYKRELDNDKAKGTEKPWSENRPTCTSDIDGFCNGGELPGMVLVGSMTYFQDHRWLKSFFENFHELEYEVLVKLQEWWWKVNAHGIALFTRMENFGRGPYVNMKTEWASNPYLDVNRIFGRDYEASNVCCTQENQGHKGDPIHEPLNYKVRRFEIMKYSFDDDEEYITIKESEYLNYSKDSLDAYRELLRLIDEGWVVTTPEDE
ncbi:hypothetical protein Tco_0367439 [Tanacetum coccineum]